jgi:hypothetical protein
MEHLPEEMSIWPSRIIPPLKQGMKLLFPRRNNGKLSFSVEGVGRSSLRGCPKTGGVCRVPLNLVPSNGPVRTLLAGADCNEFWQRTAL